MYGIMCQPPSPDVKPPPLNVKPGDVDSWDWEEVLIHYTGYIDKDEPNHSTARCKLTDKDMELQVTFWLAPPPRVSYFRLASYGITHSRSTELAAVPRVIATGANLALITVRHHCPPHVFDLRTCADYFVYRAPVAAGQSPPELTRLPHPDPHLFLHHSPTHYFPHDQVAFLRYRRPNSDLALGRHGSINHDAYKIATLFPRNHTTPYQYVLYTYDSEAGAWSRKDTAFSDPSTEITTHYTKRVITIGGTMGWVDLWRGILLCDVHDDSTTSVARLCYLKLPEFKQPQNELPLCGSSTFFRDIAVVQGRIKFVALKLHASCHGSTSIPEGWTAATWSTTVDDLKWRKDCELHSCDIKQQGAIDFRGLFVGHPKLSLHDDNIIYLMTKVDRWGSATRLITVDMKKQELLQVVEFATLRGGMDSSYTRSAISKYLRPPPTATGTMKRPAAGMPLLASSCKKQLKGDQQLLMSMQHSAASEALPLLAWMSKQQQSGYDDLVAPDDGDKMDTD